MTVHHIKKEDITGQEEFSFATGGSELPSGWLLLDNQSTCHVFRDKNRLAGVHVPGWKAVIRSNGGINQVTEKGRFGPFEEVWHDPASLFNILSLAKLRQTHRVTFDSAKENAFVVHCEDGTQIRFVMSDEGLYYYDMNVAVYHTALVNAEHQINTVRRNMAGYSPREIKQAKIARDAMALMRFPSEGDMATMISRGIISNCPITVGDVRAAKEIFGPDMASIKGKTVRRKSPRVQVRYVDVPEEIYQRNKKVCLALDIMTVNGLPFLVTVSLKNQSCYSGVHPGHGNALFEGRGEASYPGLPEQGPTGGNFDGRWAI